MPFTTFPTSFGACGIAWGDAGITRFTLPGEDGHPLVGALASRGTDEVDELESPAAIQDLITRVRHHLAGEAQEFRNAALDWSIVTEFQRGVYAQAQAIRPGSTRSYGDLARALGLGPEASRAVGVALATNPWPLLVPCHRVVSATGKMTGFSAPGGVRTKTRLLALEGAELISE